MTLKNQKFLGEEVAGTPTQKFLLSLNFLLSILGYAIVMGFLAPLGANLEEGENVYFTYPYRVFQMLVAGMALYSVRSFPIPKISFKLGLLGLFWIFYFIRAFWDCVVSPPLEMFISGHNQWYYAAYVFIDFFPLLATLKGWRCIDFERVIKWILILGGIGLLFSMRSMQAQVMESWTGELGRVAATQMLHTQALGGFGCFVSIVAFWTLMNNSKLVWKILAGCIGLLAVYMMLKAGSRGPLFAFAIVLCTFLSMRNKNFIVVVFVGAFLLAGMLLLHEQILDLIKEVSPTMAHRMEATIEGGDTSGRDIIWATYWAECLKNPLFGYQLDKSSYSHNMFIDGFMMFGLFAGWIVTVLIIIAVIAVFRALRAQIPNSWWVLFLLGQLSQAFTESGFSGLQLQTLLILLLIYESQQKNFSQATSVAFPPSKARNIATST